ncbi:MAG: class I SAM-dependent methyltransferase, partial [bacterium]
MYGDTSDIETADNDVRYVQTGNMNFCGLAHETRYNWVLEQCDLANKIILDFGCGSGYGAYMLAKRAQLVLGVDYSQRAINYAIRRYQLKNLKFINIDACSKDVVHLLGEHSFDFVISFDVIEHIERYFDYIENILSLMVEFCLSLNSSLCYTLILPVLSSSFHTFV